MFWAYGCIWVESLKTQGFDPRVPAELAFCGPVKRRLPLKVAFELDSPTPSNRVATGCQSSRSSLRSPSRKQAQTERRDSGTFLPKVSRNEAKMCKVACHVSAQGGQKDGFLLKCWNVKSVHYLLCFKHIQHILRSVFFANLGNQIRWKSAFRAVWQTGGENDAKCEKPIEIWSHFGSVFRSISTLTASGICPSLHFFTKLGKSLPKLTSTP